MHQDDRQTDIALEQAEYSVKVVPTLTGEGKTRLQFTPQIRHGEAVPQPVPAPDRSGFVLQFQQPTETYSGLAWDVTLAPNEYVVVGGQADQPDTIGYQCFVRRDEPVPVQRLLVIRTCRQAPGVTPDASFLTGEEEPSPSKTPALALQAAWTSARGSSR
jgi:hypothetical protein